MEENSEQFNQLRQALKLKRHEAPPPGYFDRLPGAIISRIRVQQAAPMGMAARLEQEAPWLLRLVQSLSARPVVTGGVGAVLCSLILGGLIFSEGSPERAERVPQSGKHPPFLAGTAALPEMTPGSQLLDGATNLNGTVLPNLFDLVPQPEMVPASYSEQ